MTLSSAKNVLGPLDARVAEQASPRFEEPIMPENAFDSTMNQSGPSNPLVTKQGLSKNTGRLNTNLPPLTLRADSVLSNLHNGDQTTQIPDFVSTTAPSATSDVSNLKQWSHSVDLDDTLAPGDLPDTRFDFTKSDLKTGMIELKKNLKTLIAYVGKGESIRHSLQAVDLRKTAGQAQV